MRYLVLRALYRLFLPVFFVLSLPLWVVKMFTRRGWGSEWMQRFSWYGQEPVEYEPCGGVYIHAVSVGEVLIALKLINQWKKNDHQTPFVLATTTPTGFAVAEQKAPDGVRVIYSPLDFAWMIKRVLKRFEPKKIVLIEAEVWPELMKQTQRMGIEVSLVNARLSPLSLIHI